MRVNALKCKKCGDVIYSRSTHDMRWCSCRNCAIDGGFDYCKISFQNLQDLEQGYIDLDDKITKTILHEDWSFSRDEYGLIKNGEIHPIEEK